MHKQWHISDKGGLLQQQVDLINTKNVDLLKQHGGDPSYQLRMFMHREAHYGVNFKLRLPDDSEARVEVVFPADFPAFKCVARVEVPKFPANFKTHLHTGPEMRGWVPRIPAAWAADPMRLYPCLYQQWAGGTSAVAVVNRVADYMARFVIWQATGKWPEKINTKNTATPRSPT